MIKSIFLFFQILFLYPVLVMSQANQDFRLYEDSLRHLALNIPSGNSDSERKQANDQFAGYFKEVLLLEGAFHYDFDSLNTISILKAPDESFRIITWYVPLQDDNFEYFGFFQFNNPVNPEKKLITLQKSEIHNSDLQSVTLEHEKWHGNYYTDLIHRTYDQQDHYLLIGWRADNPMTRKRILEPLHFSETGMPLFGNQIFQFEDNSHHRIIFEYSSKVSMTIRYDDYLFPENSYPEKVIIFDRLVPTKSFLKGHYQFYVPEMNIFDAFRFVDGNWIFVEDIDMRNPRRNPPTRPLPLDSQ